MLKHNLSADPALGEAMALQQRYTSNELREQIKAKGNILLSQALPWEAKNDIQQLIDYKPGDMKPELAQRLIQLNQLENSYQSPMQPQQYGGTYVALWRRRSIPAEPCSTR